jgi:4-hydroxyacetophenone monooxygenase
MTDPTGANQANSAIVESDAELAALVEGMSSLALAMSAVHMSGSVEILRSIERPKAPAFNGDLSGSLPPQDAASIRAQALAIIKAWRDAGRPEPYRPSAAELHEMMNFVVGMDLPEDYLPMVQEDMGLDGDDARAFHWNRDVPEEEKGRHPVIIIGAGMSGMLIGLRLKQAGIPFTIVEKNESVGGTWFENQYPGLRVDVPSHAYSFSFLQDHRWPNLYSFQPELLSYFRKCAARFGIEDHIRYGLEVTEAVFDETNDCWNLRLKRCDGANETLSARSLVSATGFLNRPKLPQIQGMELFCGPSFHSARWRHDLSLEGKRVAVIGNAATALQAIPEIAKIAGHLTIFQRSPGWTSVHPEYDRPIRDAEQWAIEHLPYYSGWMRATIFNWAQDFKPDLMKVDPEWPQDGKSVSAMNEWARARMTAAIEKQLEGRPDLLAKVLPDYPPYVKRPTVSNGNYFRAIRQDNVELITDGIDRITPVGVVDVTGRLHEVDVIVFATGFEVQKFLFPMVIKGRGGIELNAFWRDRPGGYLGIVVPRFPNFYMMYGPGTNLGYNGNLIFNSELQARYIAHCIRFMVEDGRTRLEVRDDVFEDYMERTGRKLQDFVWATDYGTTYFRNAAGRVTTNSPWSLIEMWSWTKDPDSAHFVPEPVVAA